MGSKLSVPKDSPLVCLWGNLKKFNFTELQLTRSFNCPPKAGHNTPSTMAITGPNLEHSILTFLQTQTTFSNKITNSLRYSTPETFPHSPLSLHFLLCPPSVPQLSIPLRNLLAAHPLPIIIPLTFSPQHPPESYTVPSTLTLLFSCSNFQITSSCRDSPPPPPYLPSPSHTLFHGNNPPLEVAGRDGPT